MSPAGRGCILYLDLCVRFSHLCLCLGRHDAVFLGTPQALCKPSYCFYSSLELTWSHQGRLSVFVCPCCAMHEPTGLSCCCPLATQDLSIRTRHLAPVQAKFESNVLGFFVKCRFSFFLAWSLALLLFSCSPQGGGLTRWLCLFVVPQAPLTKNRCAAKRACFSLSFPQLCARPLVF